MYFSYYLEELRMKKSISVASIALSAIWPLRPVASQLGLSGAVVIGEPQRKSRFRSQFSLNGIIPGKEIKK